MTNQRRLVLGANEENWGVMGVPTERKRFSYSSDRVKVGDLVAYRFKNSSSNDVYHGVVVYNNERNHYCIMGSASDNLNNHPYVKVVVPHNLLTQEILIHRHSSMKIKEEKVIPLTKNEIEAILGYKINILG